MVPVAVNLHLLRHGKYAWQKDAQGRRVELMHYRPGTKEKLSQYQGIWILSPDGEILATYGNRDPSFHWDQKINEPLARAFLDRINDGDRQQKCRPNAGKRGNITPDGDTRNDINQMQINPFINYNLGRSLAMGSVKIMIERRNRSS